MATYLVERFLVDWTPDEVRTLLEGAADASGELRQLGVHHLGSVFVPCDEACLSLYDAPDADAIRAAEQHCGLPAGRVLAADAYGQDWGTR
jgi:Protein of unknown function (DUF4242)